MRIYSKYLAVAACAGTVTLQGCDSDHDPDKTTLPPTTAGPTRVVVPTKAPMPGSKGSFGAYVWFDNPVWCSPWGWEDSGTECTQTDPETGHPMYVWEGKGDNKYQYKCGPGNNGFDPVVELVSNTYTDLPEPARNLGSRIFQWGETLCGDPPLCTADGWGNGPKCFGGADNHKDAAYRSMKAYMENLQFTDGDSGETVHVPVSLMYSDFRVLRWGLVMGEHVDPVDGVRFGGATKLNADCSRQGNRCEDLDGFAGDQGSLWSKYYPNNEADTSLDDYDITINYVERILEFLDSEHRPNLGARASVDIYLDVELLQLSHVSPLGDDFDKTKDPIGTGYPGTAGLAEGPLAHWSAPARAAEAYWRMLRHVRKIIDERNAGISEADFESGKKIRTTLSAWLQQAYNWVSPRWTIDEAIFVNDPSSKYHGLFTGAFGTGKVTLNGEEQPWECPCCAASDKTQTPNAAFKSKVIDDFSIVNCVYEFCDSVALGSYHNAPAQFASPWQEGRSDTAVDMVGPTAKVVKPLKEYRAGDGVPLVEGERVDFTDGAIQDNEFVYRYNPMGAWPKQAAAGDNEPTWEGGIGEYWNMKFVGWVPFVARFLKSLSNMPASTKCRFHAVLESTPLTTGSAGGSGLCAKNSLANEWGWTLGEEDKMLMLFGTDEPGTMCSRGYDVSNAWGVKPAMRLLEEKGLLQYLDSTTPIVFNDFMSYSCLSSNEHRAVPGQYLNSATSEVTCDDPTTEKFSGCKMPDLWN